MQVRQSCQSCKHLTNSGNSRKFIWNATQDCINPLEIPFWHNVCRCRVRICRNIIVWVTQKFRIKIHQISSSKTLSQSSHQIFCIEVGIKVYQISLCINSQRIGGSILMQCSKVNQTQPPLLKRKLIVKTKEPIQCRIIYTKASPLPTYNTSSNNGQSTSLTCNNGSSPKRHLTPRLHITNKSCQNHNQQNYNSKQPYKFTRLCITGVVQTTEKMHINYNKKQTPSVCMQITQLPTIRYITHLVLYTMKCLIYMSCIMHCQKNTSPNL